MEKFKEPASRKVEWSIAGILGVIAGIVYFVSMAPYAFPGESARLLAVWRGLDTATFESYPIMRFFATLLGTGNLIAPICGVISTVCLYHIVSFFVRERIGGENMAKFADAGGRIAGVVAALVCIFTPAVHEAATHLEPRMFSATWLLMTVALLIPASRASGPFGAVFPGLVGLMTGLGAADSPSFVLCLPLFALAIAVIRRKQGRKPYAAAAAVVFFSILAYGALVPHIVGDFTAYLRAAWATMCSYWRVDGWLFVTAFSTLPFFAAMFASAKAYNDESHWMEWVFHLTMSFVSILAVATPLSPSSLMARIGILPVLTSVFAAAVTGYLTTYWWLLTRAEIRDNESETEENKLNVARKGRPIALIVLPVVGIAWFGTTILNAFVFDGGRGAFADSAANRILDDLGQRHWLVTDGTLDSHVRLAAAERNRGDVHLICLQRDLDERYLADLSALVKKTGVGGERNEELLLSLSLGVLPFVQDWFAVDASAKDEVAIFGAPDLWYSAGVKAVPEFLFFGADPAARPDWSSWKEFSKMLETPEKAWGSYRLHLVRSPVDRMRLNLRRHLGLVANDRGVYLQDVGRDDEAFAMYELVLNEIDRDNVCALFNEFEMARLGKTGAVAKKNEIERRLKAIVDDADRRYRLWSLANYYGYIRSPEIFIRLGFTWARSGRPGDALNHIRRAIDLIPTDRRASMMNMMAALYANDSDRTKSREVYEQVLSNDAENHDALIGLMRLELVDGNIEKALGYLDRASKSAKEGPRADMERAMLALMKGELDSAKKMFQKLVDADAGNLRAWSMLAAVTMQQCDATKDVAERKKLTKELEDTILPAMEKQARSPFDYYVQTTKAFVLMRKGEDKRKEARDALIAAAKARPDVTSTADLVLGLDISLNDPAQAEKHARDMLRKNRKAPLANYVMGSLELQKGDYERAESYLRKAVDSKKPIAIAQNDLAEVLRRTKKLDEAEIYARKATVTDPKLYVAWETLGVVLLDGGKNLDEAEKCITKACDLSRVKGRAEDIRMLVSLARVQLKKGDRIRGNGTLRRVRERLDELSAFEKKEYEDLVNSAR